MKRLMIILVSMLSLIAACTGRRLTDTEWVLISLQGEEPRTGTEITLRLEESTFTGFDGCNQYGGEYKVSDDHSFLVIEVWRSLLMCPSPEGIMAQGTTYRQVLSDAATYQLRRDRLTLKDDEGERILIFARKEGSEETGFHVQTASFGPLSDRIQTQLDDAEFRAHLYAVNAHFGIAPPTEPAPGVAFQIVRVPKH